MFEGIEVVPLTWSPHLAAIRTPPSPSTGIDLNTPCEKCGHVGDVMICLGDNRIFCGRHANGCMLAHCGVDVSPITESASASSSVAATETSATAAAADEMSISTPRTSHVCPIVMSFRDLSIWDYSQDAYLDMFNIQEIQPHYTWLHEVKFKETPKLPSVRSQIGAKKPPVSHDNDESFTLRLEVLPTDVPAATSSSSPLSSESSTLSSLPADVMNIMKQLDVRPTGIFSPASSDQLRESWANYSMFHRVSKSDRDALVASVTTESACGDRAVGCIMGMAIGDAIGAQLEFLPVTDEPNPSAAFSLAKLSSSAAPVRGARNRLSNLWSKPHEESAYSGKSNKFQLKEGQYTDDTSMGLCMADSLLACSATAISERSAEAETTDWSDVRKRFHLWWTFGYCNAFRLDPTRSASVGLGGNIAM